MNGNSFCLGECLFMMRHLRLAALMQINSGNTEAWLGCFQRRLTKKPAKNRLTRRHGVAQ
jgi:hypothetical protein